MKKITGIYAIRHLSGRIYVGSSVHIYQRWNAHKGYLKRNQHPNKALQNYYNKYGHRSFEFYVIEQCSVGELLKRESFWISKFKSAQKPLGFNLTATPHDKQGKNAPMYGKSHSKETIQKMRHAATTRWADQAKRKTQSETLKNNYLQNPHLKEVRSKRQSKPTLQMSLDGQVLARFASALDAANAIGVDVSTICKCCRGVTDKVKGFRWTYENTDLAVLSKIA